ncbi:MAG: tetratricopeptide repeat protein [Deltaproteobacteria bacterium]|nr:tetratricopeptide repeat protein [Deltaproteobacteria bacterium]
MALVAAWFPAKRLVAQLYVVRAQARMEKGHFGLAARQLQRAISWDSGDPSLWEALGEARLAASRASAISSLDCGNANLAFAAFERAIELRPEEPEYWHKSGESLLRLENLGCAPEDGGDFPSSISRFRRAVKLRPNGILYRQKLARAQHRLGLDEELAKNVAAMAVAYPPAVAALTREAFWGPSCFAAAKQALLETLAESGPSREVLQALSCLYEKQELFAEAAAYLEKSLVLQSFKNSESHYLRLGRLKLLANLPDAGGEFLRAMYLTHDPANLLHRIFLQYKDADRLADFVVFFREAGGRASLPLESRLVLGQSLFEDGLISLAEEVFTGLAEQNPGDPEVWRWLAECAQKREDWDKMELSIQRATVLAPDVPFYHYLFSVSLEKQGKLLLAEHQMELALSGENPPASMYNRAGRLSFKRKDYERAYSYYRKAATLVPENARHHFMAGKCAYLAGDLAAARMHLKEAIRLEPGEQEFRQEYDRLFSPPKK